MSPILPTTTLGEKHVAHPGPTGSRLSKRSIKGLIAGGLVLTTYTLYSFSSSSYYSSSPGHRIAISELDAILENHASPEVVNGVYEGEGLTSLGLEADESFHLGETDKTKYRMELEEFVHTVFPKKWQTEALRSIQRHLGENYDDQTSFSPIPHKIWQTAKVNDPDIHPQWKNQAGFDYQFMNDATAGAWMKQQFEGSLLHWTWNRLPVGILRSDFLRYIFVLFEGGIYSDTDTAILKDFSHWGHGAEEHDPSVGPPSLIVGIEADVGTRSDWHKWWPRPLQICQWTIASAPLHPVLIDTVKRIYDKNVEMEEWRKKEGWSESQLDETLRKAVKEDEVVGSVMEWTGPGVFTDAVMRYLKIVHTVDWPAFKDIRVPQRYREAVVLPVTGFSPGVGLFNAGEVTDNEAMVHHFFSGSWKNN